MSAMILMIVGYRVSHQKDKVQFSWRLSAITELQTPTIRLKKKSAHFTVISALYYENLNFWSKFGFDFFQWKKSLPT
jgi:hypothetical protein